jgi:hypothetical protein
MNTSINTTKVYAVFAKADNSQADFATQLFNLGIFSRKEAQPHAARYVADKYKVKVIEGQRGLTVQKDTDAYKAMMRILGNCFETVKSTSTSVNKADPVKSLVTRFGNLSAAEKRRFLASI